MTIDFEQFKFWAMLGGFFLSGGLAVLRVSWVVNEAVDSFKDMIRDAEKKQDEAIATTKGEFNARLEIFDRDQSDKVKRVYERFDDHKRICDDKFVNKEMCGIMHSGTAEAIRELKVEIKALHGKIDRLMEVRADA